MGVRGDLGVWGGDEEATRHAEVDDPFGNYLVCGGLTFGLSGEANDDVFADALDVEDGAIFEAFGLERRPGFEGLFVGAEPGFDDAVAAQALVDAASDCFYFRQLRHSVIVDARPRVPDADR